MMRFSRQIGTGAAAIMIMAPIAMAANPSSAAATRTAAKPRVAVHGDFDGDGKADIVIGAPDGDRVLVKYTKAKLHGSHTQWIVAPSANAFNFGAAIATGDFNGDGFADLAVGAPGYTGDNHIQRGAVYIFDGSKTGLHYSGTPLFPPSTLDLADANDFGSSLATGNLTGDRYTDLAIGDPDNNVSGANQGVVTVMSGSHSGLKSATDLFSHVLVADGDFGQSVALADVNGDGRADVVVGEPGGGPTLPGGVSTTSGDIQVFLDTAAHGLGLPRTYLGSTLGASGGLGSSLAEGTINHDRYADIVTGAPAATVAGQGLAGKVAVLFGGKHGLSATTAKVFSKSTAHVAGAAVSTDRFGLSVAVGDLNDDKLADVIVGVPGGTAGGQPAAGQVYVFRGTNKGVTATKSQVISQATAGVTGNPVSGGELGSAVTTVGAAGAAHRELLIGVPAKHQGGWTLILRGGSRGVTGAHSKAVKDTRLGDLFGDALAL
jgi:hypothetical protein